MKILIVIPALGSIYGGPSKIALELADALSQQSVQVDIVATNANGNTNLDVPIKTWVPTQAYRIQYFSHWGLGDYKISGSLTQWLFQHIKDYDIVHTIALFSYPIAITHWLCQRHNIPYIMNPQGMLEPWALAYKLWKKCLFYALFEKIALQNASALHMLSAAEAQCIKTLHIQTPTVIVANGLHRSDYTNLPNPVLFHQVFPGLEHKNIILFLGRIDPKKGLDLLAPAFAKVLDHFPTAHLVIAGPDNIGFLPTVQSYFEKAQCFHAVTFTGMLTGDLKKAALAAAQVYVAPSYSEGFSISVLEGMASGLPCIITTGCNFPEAATAQAAYVVDINSESIAHALIQCLANPQAAQEMGQQARQLIFSDYTWDSIAKKMIRVYEAILNDRPIPYTQ